MSSPIVRFAPSPTGKLHVGNVRTALMNVLFVKNQGGTFVLRIDDTDLERSTDAFEQGIRDDLSWLGVSWGRTFKQSERFDMYDEAANKLRKAGLLYACTRHRMSWTAKESCSVLRVSRLFITALRST